MALVRIEILAGRSPEEKRQLLDAVHDGLVAALHVPPGDATLRVVEHRPEDVALPTWPRPVGDRYTLIEITMFSGRSAAAKRELYRELVRRLGELGTPEPDVTVVLVESPPESWGVRGGRPASEVELGFRVDV